ncbi:MAG: GumC family protein [Pseudomonadota bacterium]
MTTVDRENDIIEEFELPNISDYWAIILKHKALVIAFIVIVVTLAMLFSFLTKKIYKATSTMAIEREEMSSPLIGESVNYGDYASQSLTFNTHFKIITSRPVLEKVIKNLNLDQRTKDRTLEVGFWGSFLTQLKANIRLLLGISRRVFTPEEELDQTIKSLEGKIKIEQVRNTRLLKINVEDHDPKLASDIANTLARGYIEFNVENRVASSQSTLKWMTDQLYRVKKTLEDAERDFLAYKQKEKLFSVEEKQNVLTKKMQDFNDVYVETRNKRLEIDARLAELRRTMSAKGDVLRVRSLIENPVVESLYGQLLSAEVEHTTLARIFKEKHPKIQQVETQIDNIREKLNEELKKELDNMEAQRKILNAKEAVLLQTVDDFENDALDTNRRELQYIILQRNVETNQKLYDTLLVKVKETNISGNTDVSNIRIVEQATVPLAPIRPKKRQNFILSLIAGTVIGVGFAFLIEYIDRSLRTEADVERYLGIPVLTVIPDMENI